MINGALITDRQQYFRQHGIDRQKSVVTYKSCSTVTTEALVWTYRTTNCDVASIITTTVPFKDAMMKDIKMETTEVKRLKPPMMPKSKKDLLGNSPYDFGLSIDVEKKKSKMNQILHQEKKDFMQKLNLTRLVRSRLENDAATRIQSAYRGYSVRSNFLEISRFANINRMVRLNIRTYLEAVNYPTARLGYYQKVREQLRRNSAIVIRSAFLRYLSRTYARRRRFELDLRKRHRSATLIQARIRGGYARTRVMALIEKRRMIQCFLASVKIQAAVRRMYARRRVHQRRLRLRWIAARIIQFWYRAKYSRRIAAQIRTIMTLRRMNSNAVIIQNVVRRFVTLRRVNRIRLRRLHVLVFGYVTRMQCLVRRFLARHRVQQQRRALQKLRADLEERRIAAEEATRAAKEAQETKELLESADLFLQASRNNIETVEDIYKGLVGGDLHTPHEVDDEGDTILTIAARLGSLDLVRKSLMWDFDINHRNAQGLSAVMLAARHNHLQLLQYLFTFLDVPGSTIDPDKMLLLTTEDIGFLLTAAAANANGTDISMLQVMFAHSMFVSEVNAKAQHTGMTAMHAACEVGNIDAFKFLWKHKARMDDVDSTGQTPLHKAVTSSVTLTQWILGLDPNFQTYMSDPVRRASILTVDQDGKDCVLLATLAGQNEVLDVLEKVLDSSLPNNNTNAAGVGSLRKSVSTLVANPISAAVVDAAAAGTTVVPSVATAAPATASNLDIGWTAQDVMKALALVQAGNLYCVRKLVDAFHFDPNWPEEETAMTMALQACKTGDVDMIDLIFELKGDFSLLDAQGRSVLHFAALSPPPSSANGTHIMIHLFTHAKAKECQITPLLLLHCDSIRRENPVHYAARCGHELNIDLLVGQEIMLQAMNAVNADGMSALLLACSYGKEKMLSNLLKLGAEPQAVDHQDHGALWHLYHPHPDAIRPRIFGGESPGMILPVYSPSSTHVVFVEIHLVMALLRAGCALYSNYALSPSELCALPDIAYSGSLSQGPHHNYHPRHEVGDILLQDATVVLLKLLIGTPNLLMPLDIWRLLLGSLRYDNDKNLKMFQLLWKAGVLDTLSTAAALAMQQQLQQLQQQELLGSGGSVISLTSSIAESEHSVEQIAAAMASVVVPSTQHHSQQHLSQYHHHSTGTSTTTSNTTGGKRITRQQSLIGRNSVALDVSSATSGGGTPATSSSGVGAGGSGGVGGGGGGGGGTGGNLQASVFMLNVESLQCARMQEVWFLDMNLAAWVVALHNNKALQYLVKRGVNATLSVDSGGHPLLHWVVLHGTPEMVDILLADNSYASNAGSETTAGGGGIPSSSNSAASAAAVAGKRAFIRLEQADRQGFTAAMRAVQTGNWVMFKKLLDYRASPRKALQAKYAAWVLAFVRRFERREINTQTGRVGDDDDQYFSVSPDPFYSTWYHL
jgi:ankyrin repeat protein